MQTSTFRGLTTFTLSATVLILAACNAQPPVTEPNRSAEPLVTIPEQSARIDTTEQKSDNRRTGDHSDRHREEQLHPQTRIANKAYPAGQSRPAASPQIMHEMADATVGHYFAPPQPHPVPPRHPVEPVDRENYAHHEDNPVKLVAEQPVSTFSIDVDTGSYSNLRRLLKQGQLPPQDAVRVEELINYFDYSYAAPRDRHTPFGTITEVAVTPWNANTRLMHIGIQGWKPDGAPPPANLVFLIDVSGSMHSQDKLPLLKNAMQMLTRQMGSRDRISLVVYAGGSGVVLEPTPGDQHARIAAALEQLQAGGSTNGAAGIRQAYAMAEQGFIQGGINRVILCTDGDFNVGTTSFEQLIDIVEHKRDAGISLTTLGFGSGNYNDHLMEQLADKGNGNHGYIDSLNEAQKLLVDGLRGTLETIAKDVKIQVEFNPAVVAEYRLIGYENRMLRREDFNNDRIDAGEIGAGHSVTALYEIALVGSEGRLNEPLRYGGTASATAAPSTSGELAFLRLRYKAPDGHTSRLIEKPIQRSAIRDSIAGTSEAFRFAAAVAAFGQRMRNGHYTGQFGYADIRQLASAARGADRYGYRGEFLQLVSLAQSLDHRPQHSAGLTEDGS